MSGEFPSKKESEEGSNNLKNDPALNKGNNEELNDEKPILSLSIDMDDEKTEKLLIFKNDDIRESIISFSKKYQLSQDQSNLILNQIEEKLGDNMTLKGDIGQNLQNSVLKNEGENFNLLNSQIPSLNKNESLHLKEVKDENKIKGGFRSAASNLRIKSKNNNLPLIDKNSQKIVNAKGLDHVNVFQRLAIHSVHKKNLSNKNNEMSNHSFIKLSDVSNIQAQNKSVMNLSYSRDFSRNIYLYDKGLKSMKQKMELSIQKQKEKEEKELSEYTFAPKINNTYLTKRCVFDLQDSLSSLSKIKNSLSIQVNEENYKFKPDLSLTSRRINDISLKDNVLGINRFDKLFHDSQEKDLKIEKLQKEVSLPNFVPSTITLDKKILEKKGEIEITHHAKLALMKKNKKIKNLENTNSSFIPEINHNYSLNPRIKNVNERLYQKLDKQITPLENSVTNEQNKLIQHKNIKENQYSSNLIQKKRNKEFTRLFNSIDTEKTGKINANQIQESLQVQTDNKLLLLIKDELQKTNNEISCSEFCLKANKLFTDLTPDEKNNIIFKDKIRKNKLKESDNLNDQFKPQINPKSKKIVASKKRDKRIVEKNYREFSKQFEQKIKCLYSEREKEIMANCTFKPQINKVEKKDEDQDFLFEEK